MWSLRTTNIGERKGGELSVTKRGKRRAGKRGKKREEAMLVYITSSGYLMVAVS